MESSEQVRTPNRLMAGFSSDALPRLQSNRLDWQQLKGSPKFDYPIDYSVAVTDVDRAAGVIEFIAKWAPNSYCHFHRHLGRTISRVLQGEHHIVDTSELQILHKTRKPGFQGPTPAGDLHMEYGGQDGTTVIFLCEAIDGNVFDIVAKDGTVLATTTLDDFASGRLS
ncbi:MAG TPA: hypothetical protein VMA09_08235 [Candidatus Binataceae bacterium]|nr:hypothetical protein [Candidatus Binataceae bacterium]